MIPPPARCRLYMRMRNSDVKNKRMSPKKAAALLAALLLFVYFIAAEITLQVMLVPSFMEKLDSFSDFTDKGYSEMIYTDDIVGNREEALTETQSWLQEKGVKLISVDRVAPTLENIENGTYPLTVDLVLITRKNNKNARVEQMIEFILSESGQEIIRKTGYAALGN